MLLRGGNSDGAIGMGGGGGGQNPEYLDYMLRGGQPPNPQNMAGMIDMLMNPGTNPGGPNLGFLERAMRQRQPEQQGGGRRGPQEKVGQNGPTINPEMMASLQKLMGGGGPVPPGGGMPGGRMGGPVPGGRGGSPMPMGMGGMGGPVAPGGGMPPPSAAGGGPAGSSVVDPRMNDALARLMPQGSSVMPNGASAGGGGADASGAGGGGGVSGTQDIWEFFKGGKTKYPPGMEPYLKEYFKKSIEVLNSKAPNYKGERVAGATGQLNRAQLAMNEAGKRAMNPNAKWESAVTKHLDPTNYSTGSARNRYSNPVVIPGAEGNVTMSNGSPGGQPPGNGGGGGGGGGLTPGYKPPNPDQPPRALGFDDAY